MVKYLWTTILMLVTKFTVCQELPRKSYDLNEIIELSKSQSTVAKIAQSIKENSYFQYSSYRAGLRPQFALNGNLADFSRDYFGVRQPDGTLIFQPRIQNYSSLGLSLSQQIGLTGGTLAVNSNLTRFDDFDRKEKQYSGVPVNISLNQPLFAFNSYRWDRKIEPLKFQEAEKAYIREVENISLQTTKYFFNVIDAQADYELAKKNLENQQVIFDIENKRINLGTTTKDKILQIKLQLLKSKQSLAKADVDFKSFLFNLKSYAAIRDTVNFSLALPINLPKVTISTERAIEEAKKNRPEFIAFIRRKLESERDLDMAKKDRFKASLMTAYGFNNVGGRLGSVYKNPNSQQTLNLGIAIPILDWGRTKGKISVASSNLKTTNYTIEQEELILIQEINNLVQSIKLISDNIETSKQADLIAQERYELGNKQFQYGKLSITELNIALNEKDNAKRDFILALRTFWEAYYQLRALTLYNLD